MKPLSTIEIEVLAALSKAQSAFDGLLISKTDKAREFSEAIAKAQSIILEPLNSPKKPDHE